MKKHISNVIVATLLCTVFVAGAFASAKEIRQRMIARLPAIKELKANGIVGENNKGFLEFVGQKKEKQDIVEAENQDRAQVYTAIAEQQGTTAELVGKHRAVQIADKAQRGEWLQDANGKWYQK